MKILVALLCLGFVACDGAASKRSVPLADLAAQLAAVECGVRTQCTGRPLEVKDQDCLTQTTARLGSTLLGEITDAVARKTAVYDERLAPECVAALRAAGCARFQTLLPDVCLKAIGGTGIAGNPCVSDFDCRYDHVCDVGDQCPGTCTARGQDTKAKCDTERACAEGLRCPDIGGVCATPLAAGAACEVFGKPCAFGLTCYSPTILEPGTCEPVQKTWAATLGQTCAILAGFFCAPGFSCPVLSDVEGELPACRGPSVSGGSCVIGLADPCPAQEYCEGSILEGTGTCTPQVTRGGACVSSRQCLLGDVCEDASCVPRQPLGGACVTDLGCWSDACVDEVCTSPNLCRDL